MKLFQHKVHFVTLLPTLAFFAFTFSGCEAPYFSFSEPNSVEGTLDPAPFDPVDVSGAALSTSVMRVQWTHAADARCGYRVVYAMGAVPPENCGSAEPTNLLDGGLTETQITGLSAATLYTVRVCAVSNCMHSPASFSSGVVFSAMTWVLPPPNPVNPTVTARTTSQISFSWASGGGSTAGYRVSYVNGTTVPAACTPATALPSTAIMGTTAALSGLTAGTTYSFRICAANDNPTPDISAGVTFSTSTLQVLPPNPTTLTSTATTNAVTLNWSSGGGSTAGFVGSYQVGSAPVDCTQGTPVSSSVLSASPTTVTGLLPNTLYGFRLCAVNANTPRDISAGISTSVNTLQLAPPDPTGVVAAANSDRQITLTWTSGGGSTVSYRVAYMSGAAAPANCTSGTQLSPQTATTAVISTLNPSTTYRFRVCALNGNVPANSSAGVTASATTMATPQAAPPNPTGAIAAANSSSQITLSWTSGGGSTTGYRIAYLSGASAPSSCSTGTQIGESQISGTSKVVTGLLANAQYSFLLCAINGNVPPLVSSGVIVSVTTQPTVLPPPNPSALNAVVNSPTQVTLSWASGGGSTNTYTVAYSASATAPANCTSGTQIGSLTQTSRIVAGLAADTQYSFRICAANSNSPVDLSSGVTVSVRTLQNPPPNPTGLTAMPTSSSQINLSWSSAGGSTTSYRVAYQAGATAPSNCTVGSAAPNTNTSITGLVANTQYSFRVCALNGNAAPDISSGVTVSSTTLSIALPPNPTSLALTFPTSTSASLTWTSGGGTTVGYLASYQLGGTAPTSCATGITVSAGAISGASASVQGLIANSTYSFRVCAINANTPADVSPGVTVSGTNNTTTPESRLASVQSILSAKCQGCHSGWGTLSEAQFISQALVKEGQPLQSVMYTRLKSNPDINPQTASQNMPLGANALTANEISTIKNWILQMTVGGCCTTTTPTATPLPASPLGNRFYAKSMLTSVFGANANYDTYLMNNVSTLGGPCDSHVTGQCPGGYRGTTLTPAHVGGSVSSEAWMLKACLVSVGTAANFQAMMNKVHGSTSTALAPTSAEVEVAYNLFYPDQPITSSVRSALLAVATQGTTVAADKWVHLFLTICADPYWRAH